MASSSSSNRNSAGLGKGSRNVYCYCGDKMKVRTSWTKTNPGRRFIGCPNYVSLRFIGCLHFWVRYPNFTLIFVNFVVFWTEMQNVWICGWGASKSVLQGVSIWIAYTMFNLWQRESVQAWWRYSKWNSQNLEDLTFTKSKIKLYDRLFICLVILCLCYVVVAFAP